MTLKKVTSLTRLLREIRFWFRGIMNNNNLGWLSIITRILHSLELHSSVKEANYININLLYNSSNSRLPSI
jgi:hypothetical protein